jgi:hypothetical protein
MLPKPVLHVKSRSVTSPCVLRGESILLDLYPRVKPPAPILNKSGPLNLNPVF